MAQRRKTYGFKIPLATIRDIIDQFLAFNLERKINFQNLVIRRGKTEELSIEDNRLDEFWSEYDNPQNSYMYLVGNRSDADTYQLILNYQAPPENNSPETTLTIKLPDMSYIENIFFTLDKINEIAQKDDQNSPLLDERLYPVIVTQEQIGPIFPGETAEEMESPIDFPISVYIKALADKPAKIDLLGFEDYAMGLVDFSTEERTEKPIAIGIDAPWGMGKSSLMKMIEKELKNRKHHTVWFDAWKNDNTKDIWANIISEIFRQVGKQLGFWRRSFLSIKMRWVHFDYKRVLARLAFIIVYIVGLSFVGYSLMSMFRPEMTFDEFLINVTEYLESNNVLALFVSVGIVIKFLWDTLTPLL